MITKRLWLRSKDELFLTRNSFRLVENPDPIIPEKRFLFGEAFSFRFLRTQLKLAIMNIFLYICLL